MDVQETSRGPGVDRPLLALLGALVLAVAIGWLFLAGGIERFRPRQGGTAGSSQIGQPAPSFSLERADGGEVQLSDLRGKVVLVNFWATWCGPCLAEMPEIQRTYREHQERGFAVLAVNLRESQEQVLPFAEQLGLTFPLLLDRDGQVTQLYRARGLPSTFIIDREGIVRYARVGPVNEEMIEKELSALLR